MSAFALPDTSRLCAHLMREREVYAACEDDGEVRFRRLREPQPLGGSPPRPLVPPKQFFFADRESLFAFDRGRFIERLPEVAPLALFGVTACDLVAIAYQDRFFAQDAHYQRRRAATLLVGADCSSACELGFCHEMDAGPHVAQGVADLIVHCAPGGDATLLVESAQGRAAVADLALGPARPGLVDERAAAQARVLAQMRADHALHAGIDRFDAATIPAQTWDRIALQCVACTGCTTVCPTCSCSAPRDLPTAAGLVRERVWDSCLLEGFQREASGHNPTALPGQRVLRFWYHKLSRDFVPAFGRRGCVGCGRCDAVCPGAIGARAVLARVAAP